MRVLIAEDNRLERTILRAAVVRLGHTCIEAADGNSAWDAFCLSTPDVIVSDWVMPGIQGPEVCRRVRDAAVDCPPYFILQTLPTQREHVVQAGQAGVGAYLARPVNMEDLTSTPERASDRRLMGACPNSQPVTVSPQDRCLRLRPVWSARLRWAEEPRHDVGERLATSPAKLVAHQC